MKPKENLYDKPSIDLRKSIIYIVILVLNLAPVLIPDLIDLRTLYLIIIIQGICNIDSFWDFVDNRNIKKLLKNLIIISIWLSVIGILIASIGLIYLVFEMDVLYVLVFKIISLISVLFPLVILEIDFHFNNSTMEN